MVYRTPDSSDSPLRTYCDSRPESQVICNIPDVVQPWRHEVPLPARPDPGCPLHTEYDIMAVSGPVEKEASRQYEGQMMIPSIWLPLLQTRGEGSNWATVYT